MSTLVAQAIVSGLLIGSVFALIALGLTLIFGVMKIINIAHGDFLMLGMYFALLMSVMAGVNPYVSAVLCLPIFFALGWVVQSHLIRPVLDAPENIQILVTVGISLVLQNVALFLVSPDFQSLRLAFGSVTFDIAGVSVSYVRLIACAVSLTASAGVFLFLSRSDTG
jgi:branched-chain amino acid transport system permease protein